MLRKSPAHGGNGREKISARGGKGCEKRQLGLLALSEPVWAATPAQLCESAAELASAKYAQCRLRAEYRFTRTLDAGRHFGDLTKCAAKLTGDFASASARYGAGNCTAATPAEYDAYITQCTDTLEAAAAPGGVLPQCGNGVVDAVGEQCDGADVSGETCTSLGFPGGTLGCSSGCTFDTTPCAQPSFPASGALVSNTADKNDGVVGPVAIPDDGTLRAGAALAFVDNGDGTLTDLNTGLMWEKKSYDGTLHDKSYFYLWTGDGSQNTVWDWLDQVNAEGGTGFAGHNDWRIPNVKELHSILDYGNSPAVPAALNNGCVASCTVLTCSCTSSPPGRYWTSTTYQLDPNQILTVYFGSGIVSTLDRTIYAANVRAVRGGS